MSLADVRERVHWDRPTAIRHTLARVLFGDRYGVVVFLTCCCLFGLVWRTEFFITDSYTLANGLYSLSNGDLFLTEAAYGPGLRTPGVTATSDGLIARNYGAIVLSLPFWLALEALSAVTSLRVALVGVWSLALLALVVQLSRLFDSETLLLGGSAAVLALFGANVVFARSLDPTGTHLYALQLFHLTVAAFGPVLCYRLFARIETRRFGAVAAALLVLGTPLSLWAPVPKRHALTATVVLAVAYALYRSRIEADGLVFTTPVAFRALAYAVVGLYAWVHAPEALLLFVVLFVVDVPTAPDNSRHTLGILAGMFALSLLPFLLTNVALTGSPLQPPRLLSRPDAIPTDPAMGSGGTGTDPAAAPQAGSSANATGGSGGGASTGWLVRVESVLASLVALLATAVAPIQLLLGQLSEGMSVALETPTALYQTLVRSGDAAAALNLDGQESANLAVLESAPILAALTGVVPVAWRRARARTSQWRPLAPTTAVDLFAVGFVVSLTLLYATRLPVHAQVTVRYLFPVYPLGVYLLARLPVVRDTLDGNWRLFAWTTAAALLLGGQALLVAVFWTAVGLGEAFQLHALVALASAVPLALWALLGRSDGTFGRLGAVLLGVPTALATVFVLLVAVEYYPLSDTHLLPMVRVVAELLSLL